MQKRKVGELTAKQAKKIGSEKIIEPSGKKALFKIIIVFFALILIVLLVRPFAHEIKGVLTTTAKGTVKILSKTVGTPMIKDEHGNINVLLAGYGGDTHGGGYLADSTIVASRNPEKGALTMLSIPRDLYVKNPVGGKTKLNAVFSWLLGRNKDFNEAGSGYAKMLEDITGLSIPYYATIDFSGFKKIVDDLGGIDIYVPYSIHDYQYPDENLKGYDPLHVEEGWQHMDGALALKYARSRHAAGHASDYDRSYRQQLVISAIKDKVFSGGSISLNRAKDLYESYSDMVKTNISLNEMLWTVQYVEKTKFFTFGLNVSYSDNLAYSQKGGLLYNVPQERYGASATLPFGASYGKEDQYDVVHQYADFIAHLQGFSLDNATIAVDNGISKEALREQNLQNTKVAGRLAAKMKRYGLNVVSSENVDPQDFTTVFINTENEKPEGYEGTITAIKNFLPVDQIVYNTGTVKVITDDYGNMVEVFTGTDVQIILGTSYLTYLQEQGFKPNELNLIYYEE